MNRFEVLRGFTIFMMFPSAILAIIFAYVSIATLNYVHVILTGFFIIMFFALKYNLGGLTMRIHQEYFPRNAVIVPKSKWNDILPVTFIPKAELVTED